MISDFYQVRIEDLLSIPHAGTRWILIKKALAADARSQTTKPIEFAYRDLEGAERHLIKIADDSSEFLYLPTDLEPEDEADRMSGSPLLLTFAKKANKAPKSDRRKQVELEKDDEEEIEDLDPVVESEDESTVADAEVVEPIPEVERSEPLAASAPEATTEETVSEDIEEDDLEIEDASTIDEEVLESVQVEVDAALDGADQQEDVPEALADDAVEEQPSTDSLEDLSDVEEDRAEIVRLDDTLDAEQEGRPTPDAVLASEEAAVAETTYGDRVEAEVVADESDELLDAAGNSDVLPETTISSDSDPAGEEVVHEEASPNVDASSSEDGDMSAGEVPEGHFRADIDGLLRVEQDRARWILLKKMVAAIVGRRHVRSLGTDQLGTEENAIALVRNAGGYVDIPFGEEPSDHSDFSKKATSLEAYFTTGQWSVPSKPEPARTVRRRNGEDVGETDASASVQEAGLEPESGVQSTTEQLDAADDIQETLTEYGSAAAAIAPLVDVVPALRRPPALPIDQAANETWLARAIQDGGDPVVLVEWLSRSLEAEATRLKVLVSGMPKGN